VRVTAPIYIRGGFSFFLYPVYLCCRSAVAVLAVRGFAFLRGLHFLARLAYSMVVLVGAPIANVLLSFFCSSWVPLRGFVFLTGSTWILVLQVYGWHEADYEGC
jgi:hypothetical protein